MLSVFGGTPRRGLRAEVSPQQQQGDEQHVEEQRSPHPHRMQESGKL